MQQRIIGALAAIVAGSLSGAAPSQASSLSGDTFDVSYYYPTPTSLYLDQGTFKDPAPRISIPQDPKGYGQIYPYYVRYIFGQTVHFTTAAFDGVVFKDETSSDILRVAFNKDTSATGLTASDLSSTSNTITLNLSGVTVQAGSIIQVDVATGTPAPKPMLAARQLSVVPLPAAAPMFGAALLALAGLGVARKRWGGAAGRYGQA